MTLFKQWTELMETQTEETFEAFWEEYSGAETKIYQHIFSVVVKIVLDFLRLGSRLFVDVYKPASAALRLQCGVFTYTASRQR